MAKLPMVHNINHKKSYSLSLKCKSGDKTNQTVFKQYMFFVFKARETEKMTVRILLPQ